MNHADREAVLTCVMDALAVSMKAESLPSALRIHGSDVASLFDVHRFPWKVLANRLNDSRQRHNCPGKAITLDALRVAVHPYRRERKATAGTGVQVAESTNPTEKATFSGHGIIVIGDRHWRADIGWHYSLPFISIAPDQSGQFPPPDSLPGTDWHIFYSGHLRQWGRLFGPRAASFLDVVTKMGLRDDFDRTHPRWRAQDADLVMALHVARDEELKSGCANAPWLHVAADMLRSDRSPSIETYEQIQAFLAINSTDDDSSTALTASARDLLQQAVDRTHPYNDFAGDSPAGHGDAKIDFDISEIYADEDVLEAQRAERERIGRAVIKLCGIAIAIIMVIVGLILWTTAPSQSVLPSTSANEPPGVPRTPPQLAAAYAPPNDTLLAAQASPKPIPMVVSAHPNDTLLAAQATAPYYATPPVSVVTTISALRTACSAWAAEASSATQPIASPPAVDGQTIKQRAMDLGIPEILCRTAMATSPSDATSANDSELAALMAASVFDAVVQNVGVYWTVVFVLVLYLACVGLHEKLSYVPYRLSRLLIDVPFLHHLTRQRGWLKYVSGGWRILGGADRYFDTFSVHRHDRRYTATLLTSTPDHSFEILCSLPGLYATEQQAELAATRVNSVVLHVGQITIEFADGTTTALPDHLTLARQVPWVFRRPPTTLYGHGTAALLINYYTTSLSIDDRRVDETYIDATQLATVG